MPTLIYPERNMLCQSTYPIYFDRNIFFSPYAHVVLLASCAVSCRFAHSAKFWIRKKQYIPTKKPALWVSSPEKFHTKRCRKFSSPNVEVNQSNVSNIPPDTLFVTLLETWIHHPGPSLHYRHRISTKISCAGWFLGLDYCPAPSSHTHTRARSKWRLRLRLLPSLALRWGMCMLRWRGNLCKPWSDCSFWSRLIRVYADWLDLSFQISSQIAHTQIIPHH